MDKFHVGQRVIWITPKPDSRRYVATVLSQRERREKLSTGKRHLVYRLDVDGHGTRHPRGTLYAAPEPELRPIYDGDQPASWATCAWRPCGVIA